MTITGALAIVAKVTAAVLVGGLVWLRLSAFCAGQEW